MIDCSNLSCKFLFTDTAVVDKNTRVCICICSNPNINCNRYE